MSMLENPFAGDEEKAAIYAKGFEDGCKRARDALMGSFSDLNKAKDLVHVAMMRALSVYEPDKHGRVPPDDNPVDVAEALSRMRAGAYALAMREVLQGLVDPALKNGEDHARYVRARLGQIRTLVEKSGGK